jgi:hypothetical protein
MTDGMAETEALPEPEQVPAATRRTWRWHLMTAGLFIFAVLTTIQDVRLWGAGHRVYESLSALTVVTGAWGAWFKALAGYAPSE